MDSETIRHLNIHKNSERLGLYVTPTAGQSKQLPLHEEHCRQGARFVELDGWTWIDEYGDNMINEYIELNRSAVICDVHSIIFGSLRGPNILGRLMPQLTNKSIASKPFHTISDSCILNADGAIFDDMMIFVVSHDELFLTLNESFENLIHILDNSVKENCLWADLTDMTAKLQLQGPHADRVIQDITGVTPLKAFHFSVVDNMLIAKSGFTLPGGYELFMPIDQGTECWRRCLNMGILPYGIKAMEISRVESGKLRAGHDFHPHLHWPSELGFMADHEDCHASEAQFSMNFFVSAPIPQGDHERPQIGDIIYNCEGQLVGVATSAVYSPRYRRYLGFCHLRHGVKSLPGELSIHGLAIKTTPWKQARKILQNITAYDVEAPNEAA
jgi:glycine cleavage system aminomethyltransferase T